MAEPRLFVHCDVANHLLALPPRPWEVGGWILGYCEADAIVATHITPASRGTPFFVHLSGRRHRRYFEKAWDASEGHVTFLGDWHTHPGSPPLPSERDEGAMRQLAGSADYGSGPVLVSITTTGRWPRATKTNMTCFYSLDRNKRPLPLTPHLIDELPAPANRVPDWHKRPPHPPSGSDR